jgi:glycosyltransferase involved in cell wall biosynthesis
MKKLLFLSTYTNPSVKRDFRILSKYFISKALYFPEVRKNPLSIIKYFCQIFINVLWADVCFVRFADFRALLVIVFSQIFYRKTAVAIGGYEVANEPDFNYGALRTKEGVSKTKYIISKADVVIANSEFSKNEIQYLCPKINVNVINHGIETAIQPDKIKDNVIVTIGNLRTGIYKLKGIDTFARAVKQLGVNAIAIGEYEKQVYSELKSINPELELPGFLSQNEIAAILKTAKVYCQLSYRESFGVALLEAMSCGCIPVVTKNGALPEVVGNVGFYTEFGDVKKTADAISKALKSDNSKVVIDRVNEKFLLKYREEKLLKLLTEKKWI